MASEFYEHKAQQCLRLIRACIDPRAIETLKKLAQEYTEMALALRNKERGIRREFGEELPEGPQAC